MKVKTFLIVSSLVAGLQFTPVAFAQAPDNAGYGRHPHGRHERMLANLTPEERTKLRAARQQAMADPAVQAAKDRARQARREFRDLQRAAMLRVDPSVQPILDKMPARDRSDS
jgi:Spy/CpxP family protein refolding chaperone